MNQFCHLHTHSMYSLRDAITEPEALMRKCADHGMKAVAVTDHGNLMGAWECAKYAKKYGVKYIPGNEVYVVPNTEKCRGIEWGKGKSAHLVLVAHDQQGWENLLALTTRSNLEGFYNQPRVDYKMLREHKDGLFAHSACLGGPTAKAYFANQSIHLVAEMYKDIFGDKFSLEIQLNDRPEQLGYNDALIKVAKDTDTPLIATVDSHYLDKADSHKQDLVFCLGMDKLLNDPDRHRYPPEAHSVETPDEVHARFVKQYGEVGRLAIQRTVQISDVCNATIEIETKNYKIPSIPISKVEDYSEYIEWKRKVIGDSNAETK
jgi:DNA polymerase-3 subunit alpha